jgi:hypothetical protein
MSASPVKRGVPSSSVWDIKKRSVLRQIAESKSDDELLQLIRIYELIVVPWGENFAKGKLDAYRIVWAWTRQETDEASAKFERYLDKVVAERKSAAARSELAQARRAPKRVAVAAEPCGTTFTTPKTPAAPMKQVTTQKSPPVAVVFPQRTTAENIAELVRLGKMAAAASANLADIMAQIAAIHSVIN